MPFRRGDQVAYIPDHAKDSGGVAHPDAEFGFVMRKHPAKNAYFVRYWTKDLSTLRTVANSELTYEVNLVPYQSVSDKQVEDALVDIVKQGI